MLQSTQSFVGAAPADLTDWPERAATPAEPMWTAPTPTAALDRTPAPSGPRRKGPLLLAVVAIVGVLAGAVATAALVTAAFLSAAEDIGRGMSEGLGSGIGRSVGAGLTQSMRQSLTDAPPAAGAVSGVSSGPPAAVERFPAVPPGALGADPRLDVLARSCFGGELQRCDDLWYASPPMSRYEEYAATCGGRVKRDAVAVCIELN